MQLFHALINFDGLGVLVSAVFIAGVVRGFSGFGTALIFVPIAATVAAPIWVILMMMAFDLFGPLPLMPRAWRDGEPKDVAMLILGAALALPAGVYILTQLDANLFRALVSGLALIMLALLISGWRYKKYLTTRATVAVGAVGGFLAGVAALPGPPVILSYMASPRPAKIIRANTMMYLYAADVLTIVVFAIGGLLMLAPMLIGLLLAIPYALGNYLGQLIFNPDKELIYRRVAYAIIFASAIIGLPVW